ncbi:monocarboxylate transporter 12-like [Rhipicephalus sanguineus]|uniref:monocarboxylate transporter 12-like n=1 Tax=Rhipicephalus sanguineus TaxID=34632 RepID=UPI0020C5AC22|nr:monocarboxylate transporter 12-like [Rhipicephalus sanguineus]
MATPGWWRETGLGAGIVLMCNLVEIMQYFQKYRGIASGLKFAADPTSAIVFPALLSYLRATYGLRGALLIYAALSMHVTAFSIVLKEPPWLKRDGIEALVSRRPVRETQPIQSSKAMKIRDILGKMPQPLLKPSFYAVVMGSVLLDYVNAVHLSTLVDYALDSGVSRAHAELTVTYASAPEILGRVLLPLVADVGLVSRTTLTTGNALVLGFLLLLTPETRSGTHVVVRAASSVALATLMTMKHVLVADYYGTDAVALLSGASGVLLVPVLLSNPSIIGEKKKEDFTKKFTAAFNPSWKLKPKFQADAEAVNAPATIQDFQNNLYFFPLGDADYATQDDKEAHSAMLTPLVRYQWEMPSTLFPDVNTGLN